MGVRFVEDIARSAANFAMGGKSYDFESSQFIKTMAAGAII